MPERETGVVKNFNPTKGYGFIERKEGKDVFVHANSLRKTDSLKEGDRVEFTVTQGKKGLQAEDVIVLE